MNKSSITAIIAATLFTVACDDDNDSPEQRSAAACRFDNFEVELTAGPSAPLALAGTLFMAAGAADDGALRGLFEVGDEQYPVTASYTEGGQISVSVAVDGGYVVGLGRVGALCQPDATIEGVAVGPTVSPTNALADTDTGHWLLSGAELSEQGYYYDFKVGNPNTNFLIIKIPVTQVCTQNNGSQTSCFESFCQAQKAGHFSVDVATGELICS